MKYNFKIGDKLKLKYKHREEFDGCLYLKVLHIKELNTEYMTLSDENGKDVIKGCGLDYMFEYAGKNVNNEAFDLISNNEIKSFNAILEDGRVINISCLN